MNTLNRRQFMRAVSAGAIAAGITSLTANGSRATPARQNKVASTSGLDICYMSAVDLAASIRRKDLSAVEVMTAFYDRIEEVNPSLNAIVALLDREAALALARQADADMAAGNRSGSCMVCRGLSRIWMMWKGSPPPKARWSSKITFRRQIRYWRRVCGRRVPSSLAKRTSGVRGWV